MIRPLPIAALYDIYSAVAKRAVFAARAQAMYPDIGEETLDALFDAFDYAYGEAYGDGVASGDSGAHGN